jgi:hypothetical protein
MVNIITRPSKPSDTSAMVSLSKAKRLAYEKAQPQFWRYAGEEGDNTQRHWFKQLLEDKNHLMFTAVENCHPRENGDPVLDSRLRGNDIRPLRKLGSEDKMQGDLGAQGAWRKVCTRSYKK